MAKRRCLPKVVLSPLNIFIPRSTMNITAEQAARSHESKSELTVGVSSGLMALAILLVGLRLWCRRFIKASGLDDIAAVLGLVRPQGFKDEAQADICFCRLVV
jgi:hypothetical protein